MKTAATPWNGRRRRHTSWLYSMFAVCTYAKDTVVRAENKVCVRGLRDVECLCVLKSDVACSWCLQGNKRGNLDGSSWGSMPEKTDRQQAWCRDDVKSIFHKMLRREKHRVSIPTTSATKIKRASRMVYFESFLRTTSIFGCSVSDRNTPLWE